MTSWVVDTGPLVAYLDEGDPYHDAVVERWDDFRGRLVTTSAVITEVMHFVAAMTSACAMAGVVASSSSTHASSPRGTPARARCRESSAVARLRRASSRVPRSSPRWSASASWC